MKTNRVRVLLVTEKLMIEVVYWVRQINGDVSIDGRTWRRSITCTRTRTWRAAMASSEYARSFETFERLITRSTCR